MSSRRRRGRHPRATIPISAAELNGRAFAREDRRRLKREMDAFLAARRGFAQLQRAGLI